MFNIIILKIKNQYALLNEDIDFLGEEISVLIKDNELYIDVNGFQLIKVDKSLEKIFDFKMVKNGGVYKFVVVDWSMLSGNEEIELKLKVELIKPKVTKHEIAKIKLNNIFINSPQVVGVYLLKIDNLDYVGQSTNIHRRLHEHLEELSNGTHVNTQLQDAYDDDFQEIEFQILDELHEALSPLDRQEWLEKKEIYYIEKYSNGNLANQTRGEFIPTKDAHLDYILRNKNAEDYILNERSKKKIKYSERREILLAENRRLSILISEIEEKINLFESKQTKIESVISFFKNNKQITPLLDRKIELISMYNSNRNEIFELNFQIRQLKKRKFTLEEVEVMEKMGRQYKEEFNKLKYSNE